MISGMRSSTVSSENCWYGASASCATLMPPTAAITAKAKVIPNNRVGVVRFGFAGCWFISFTSVGRVFRLRSHVDAQGVDRICVRRNYANRVPTFVLRGDAVSDDF